LKNTHKYPYFVKMEDGRRKMHACRTGREDVGERAVHEIKIYP